MNRGKWSSEQPARLFETDRAWQCSAARSIERATDRPTTDQSIRYNGSVRRWHSRRGGGRLESCRSSQRGKHQQQQQPHQRGQLLDLSLRRVVFQVESARWCPGRIGRGHPKQAAEPTPRCVAEETDAQCVACSGIGSSRDRSSGSNSGNSRPAHPSNRFHPLTDLSVFHARRRPRFTIAIAIAIARAERRLVHPATTTTTAVSPAATSSEQPNASRQRTDVYSADP